MRPELHARQSKPYADNVLVLAGLPGIRSRFEKESLTMQVAGLAMVVKIFTMQLKVVWFIQLILIALMEVTPFHSEHVAPDWFYAYKLGKCLAFVILGWLTPVAFRSSIGSARALSLTLVCALVEEASQNLIFGHQSSLLESGGKIGIICFGFICGLMSVHDKKISLFTKNIDLAWGSSRSTQRK